MASSALISPWYQRQWTRTRLDEPGRAADVGVQLAIVGGIRLSTLARRLSPPT